ncbi:MAG: SDR family NAD(P)-dependent oxidoreductase [Streptosporangiaceae bacterium]
MSTDSSHLVTGASTGIGRACVAALAGTGARVWATVRSEADEASLREQHGQAVSVVRMDLTDPDSIVAVGDRVCAAGRPGEQCWRRAARSARAIPLEVFRQQVEVNLVGQPAVTQAVPPALRQARERAGNARIVMIGSIGGGIAGPMRGGAAAVPAPLPAHGGEALISDVAAAANREHSLRFGGLANDGSICDLTG